MQKPRTFPSMGDGNGERYVFMHVQPMMLASRDIRRQRIVATIFPLSRGTMPSSVGTSIRRMRPVSSGRDATSRRGQVWWCEKTDLTRQLSFTLTSSDQDRTFAGSPAFHDHDHFSLGYFSSECIRGAEYTSCTADTVREDLTAMSKGASGLVRINKYVAACSSQLCAAYAAALTCHRTRDRHQRMDAMSSFEAPNQSELAQGLYHIPSRTSSLAPVARGFSHFVHDGPSVKHRTPTQ